MTLGRNSELVLFIGRPLISHPFALTPQGLNPVPQKRPFPGATEEGTGARAKIKLHAGSLGAGPRALHSPVGARPRPPPARAARRRAGRGRPGAAGKGPRRRKRRGGALCAGARCPAPPPLRLLKAGSAGPPTPPRASRRPCPGFTPTSRRARLPPARRTGASARPPLRLAAPRSRSRCRLGRRGRGQPLPLPPPPRPLPAFSALPSPSPGPRPLLLQMR